MWATNSVTFHYDTHDDAILIIYRYLFNNVIFLYFFVFEQQENNKIWCIRFFNIATLYIFLLWILPLTWIPFLIFFTAERLAQQNLL